MRKFIVLAAVFAALLFMTQDADAFAGHLARAHARATVRAQVRHAVPVHVNRFAGIHHVNRFNGISVYRNSNFNRFDHYHVASALNLGYGSLGYGASMYGASMFGADPCQQPVPVPVDSPVVTFGARVYGVNRFAGIGAPFRFNNQGWHGGFFGRHIFH